jgi:hypothetical protein
MNPKMNLSSDRVETGLERRNAKDKGNEGKTCLNVIYRVFLGEPQIDIIGKSCKFSKPIIAPENGWSRSPCPHRDIFGLIVII